MLDAKGRPIAVGDWVTSATEGGPTLGQVLEITEDLVHLGDGITYEAVEIITLGGYAWVICLDCNSPWVKDVNHDEEVCPFCESSRFVLDRPASPQSVAACR